jgi:pilus assembly protein CpaC
MTFELANSSHRRRHLAGSSVAALVFGLAASLALPPGAAIASDLDYTQTVGGQQDDPNFLRIGIGKTAVIKLPATVKDVIVGDPQVVDVVIRNRNTAYLFARNASQTNVFFFDANGQQILSLDLEVAVDSKAIKKLIDRTVPGNSIQVDTMGKNVVLKGTAANAQESKLVEDLVQRSSNLLQCDCQIVNAMKIAEGDQVMLKVKVVELKRTLLKELGVNTSTNLTVGNFSFGLRTGGNGVQSTHRYDDTGFSDSFSTRINIEALENEGLATTLAEPTLTAVSGAPARFHAGGELPYRVCRSVDTGTECEIEFKPYGVSLDFTPTVLTEGRINLNIRTEVSELGATVAGVPSIDTRNAQTSVEIPSGGSMMLAGLIKDVTTQDLSGTPGLRKLPVLGALFNSRAYQKNQSELVVIVTPYVVNPTSERNLATPTDGFNLPTDRQQILFGRLNKVYGTPGQHPNGVYHGKVGYIIE